MAKPKVVYVDRQARLNKLLVARAISGIANPEIEKLQSELDLFNYGIVNEGLKKA